MICYMICIFSSEIHVDYKTESSYRLQMHFNPERGYIEIEIDH